MKSNRLITSMIPDVRFRSRSCMYRGSSIVMPITLMYHDIPDAALPFHLPRSLLRAGAARGHAPRQRRRESARPAAAARRPPLRHVHAMCAHDGQAASGKPIVAAPPSLPLLSREYPAQPSATIHALAASTGQPAVLARSSRTRPLRRPRLHPHGRIRSRAGRGPPASSLRLRSR